jgi:hypothetical protein
MTWHPLLDQLRARCYPPDLFGLVDKKRDQGRNQEIAIGKQSQSVRLDRAHGGKYAKYPKLDHVVLQRQSSVERARITTKPATHDRIVRLGMPRPKIATEQFDQRWPCRIARI